MPIKNNRDKLLAMLSLTGEDGLRTILDHRKDIVSNVNFDHQLSPDQVKILTSPNGLYKLGIYEDIFAKEQYGDHIDVVSPLDESDLQDFEDLSFSQESLEPQNISYDEKFAQVDRIIENRDPTKSAKDRLALYHLVIEMVSLGSKDKLNQDIKELLLDFMHQLDDMVPFSRFDLNVVDNYTSFVAKALEQTNTPDSKAYLSLLLAVNNSVNASNRKKKIYDKIARVFYYSAISSLGLGILAVFTPLLPALGDSGVVVFSIGFVLGVQGYLKANSLSHKNFSDFQDEMQQINVSLLGGEVDDKVVAVQEKLLAYVKEQDGVCPKIDSARVLAQMKGEARGKISYPGENSVKSGRFGVHADIAFHEPVSDSRATNSDNIRPSHNK